MSLATYMQLIRAFLNHEVSAAEFEARYLAMFKAETGEISEEAYQILDALFWAVDSYWPACQSDQETPFLISEDRLRQEAHEALIRLERLAGDVNVEQ